MRKAVLTLLAALAVSSGSAFAQATPTQTSLVQQGLAALHAQNPAQALTLFQQTLQANPQDAAANLLAASAEIALFNGKAAVPYAEKAQQLAQDDWKIHTTLVAAYAMAGDTAHRDAERAILRKDHANPALRDAHQTSGFLLDLFRVKDYRVEAVEFFEPVGRFHTYYRFIVRDTTGQKVWAIEVDSDPLNQISWARAYPKQASEGQRQFQIESQPGAGEVDYGTFSGAPSYDYARTQVVKILNAQTGPFPVATPAH